MPDHPLGEREHGGEALASVAVASRSAMQTGTIREIHSRAWWPPSTTKIAQAIGRKIAARSTHGR